MNKKLIFSVMLVLLLAFIAVLAFGQSGPNVRWEYTSIRLEGADTTRFNELGAEGWELVVSSGYQGTYMFFNVDCNSNSNTSVITV